MSLAERLAGAKKPVKSLFESWVDALDPVDRDALLAAAVDPELSTQAIVRAVAEEGRSVNKDTIAAWRRKLGFTRR